MQIGDVKQACFTGVLQGLNMFVYGNGSEHVWYMLYINFYTMATHSRILAWRIPWTEELGGLQFIGSQRVRHDWVTDFHFHFHPTHYGWIGTQLHEASSQHKIYKGVMPRNSGLFHYSTQNTWIHIKNSLKWQHKGFYNIQN